MPDRLPPGLLGALRTPDVLARLRVRRDLPGFLHLHFVATAAEAGVLVALARPGTVDEVAERAAIERRDLLERLLELGVAVGELRRRDGRYRLRGRVARAVVRPDGDPLLAILRELVDYHGRVYLDLPRILRGDPEPAYLDGRRELIARSSRILEPSMRELVRGLSRARGATRMLDVGCGSGVYLRHAAEANGELRGLGVDVAPEVVEHARENFDRWGLSDRVAVVVGDARSLPAPADGPFDVITLFNNVYYFDDEERLDVLRELRARLAPQGVLAVVTMLRGSTLTAIDFDLVLGATAGCTLLPGEDDLVAQLRAAGLGRVERVSLLPGEPVAALVAHA